MREHLKKNLKQVEPNDAIKVGLIEFLFRINLVEDFLPCLKKCSVFPTLRSSAEQCELGIVIKYFSKRDSKPTDKSLEEKMKECYLPNMILSFGTPTCSKLSGWSQSIVAVTNMNKKFTPWDFFFVHYCGYFTNKILPTIADGQQLLQDHLIAVGRTDSKTMFRNVFYFGTDKADEERQQMMEFSKFRIFVEADELTHPYKLSTCINMMFKGINGDGDDVQAPPEYFNLDRHVNLANFSKQAGAKLGSGSSGCDTPTKVKQKKIQPIRASSIAMCRDAEWKEVVSKRNFCVGKLLNSIADTLREANINSVVKNHLAISSFLQDDDDSVGSGSEGSNQSDGEESNESDSSYEDEDKDGRTRAKTTSKQSKQSDKKPKKKIHEDDSLKIEDQYNQMVHQHSEMTMAIRVALTKIDRGLDKYEHNFGVEDPKDYPVTDDDENQDDKQEEGDEEDEVETPKKRKKSSSQNRSRKNTMSPKENKVDPGTITPSKGTTKRNAKTPTEKSPAKKRKKK